MSKEKLFFVGVKGLIENEKGEILLLLADVTKFRKNITPYWDIPGGRVEEGHTVLETLAKEIEEETGVSEIGEPEFVTSVISNHEIPLDGGKQAGLVLMVYKVTIPPNSQITISEEHDTYEWVSKTEAAERLQHKYPKEFTNAL